MTEPSLRIVFFGTPAFAVPTLEALLASRHQVVAVVTQPDRPRGRGHKTSDSPVKERARWAGVPILQPASMRDAAFVAAFKAFAPDLGVVAAYGKILTEEVLSVPTLGMVNVHASLLPKYRGAAPVHRAVMAGDSETGVTIMRVVKALDAGPMLAKAAVPIDGQATSDAVERALAHVGAQLLVATADRLARGPVDQEPQDDRLATYASRLTKHDGIIDWTRDAAAVHNQIRGLHPWPHASAVLDGRRLILHRSEALPSAAATGPPGTIVAANGDDLRIACGLGQVRILELQAEGGRPLPTRAFLAGHPLVAGSQFSPEPGSPESSRDASA